MVTSPHDDSPPARPRRRKDVTVHELDGEALVFDATTGDTHRLNDTALFIWRLWDGGRDAPQVTERLMEVYDVSPEAAREHVDRMLLEFQERRLVVATD